HAIDRSPGVDSDLEDDDTVHTLSTRIGWIDRRDVARPHRRIDATPDRRRRPVGRRAIRPRTATAGGSRGPPARRAAGRGREMNAEAEHQRHAHRSLLNRTPGAERSSRAGATIFSFDY